MSKINILQISDLFVGNNGISVEAIFDELIDFVDKNIKGNNFDVIHYIVICGNITAQGSPENFEKAHTLLRALGEKLLIKDTSTNGRSKETNFNRMIMIPGRTDADSINSRRGAVPDLTHFRNFHDQFFEFEPKHEKAFNFEPGHAFRQTLKDLTFIGVTYWSGKGLLKQFNTQIKELIEANETPTKEELEYHKYIPTILVSSSYPHFRNYKFEPVYRQLRENCKKLIVSLHLFGSGTHVGVLPEPYSLQHIGLGTGARYYLGFYPFRANLITMRLRKKGGSNSGAEREDKEPMISNNIFWRSKDGTTFERHQYIQGHFDSFVSSEINELEPEEAINKRFFKQIEDQIFDKNNEFIIIKGLPGSGKEKVFKFLDKYFLPDKHNVKIITHELTSYEDDDLKKKLQAIKKSDGKIILVIRDLAYLSLNNNGKSKLENFLDPRNVRGWRLSEHGEPQIRAILYFISALPDEELGVVPIPGKSAEIKLPPLDPESIDILVKRYERGMPITRADLYNISGGTAGFSYLLLEAAEENFKNFNGAQSINRQTSTKLLQQALEDDESLKKEATYYLNAIENMPGGNLICRYIEEKIWNAIKEKHSENLEHFAKKNFFSNLGIFIDIAELKQKCEDSCEKEFLDIAIGRMVKMSILEIDVEGNRNIYRLQVLAPFLIKIAARREPMEEKTEQIDFLIITALKEERKAILDLLPDALRVDPSDEYNYVYHRAKIPFRRQSGTTGTYNVIVTSSLAMGQVKAVSAANKAIDVWKPRYVLLVGIAGGYAKKGVKIGDIITPEEIIPYELQKLFEGKIEFRTEKYQTDIGLRNAVSAFTEEEYLNDLPERPDGGQPIVHSGDIASGDKVDARNEIINQIGHMFPKIIGIEMEAAGMAFAVLDAASRTKIFMIRAVSDLADKEKDALNSNEWWEYACRLAASYTIAFLKSGPVTVELSAKSDESKTSKSTIQQESTTAKPAIQENEKFTILDLRSLAEFLTDSGLVAPDSREAMCFDVGVNPKAIGGLLDIRGDKNFAVKFVSHLNNTHNRDALLKLCEILSGIFHGEANERINMLRQKIEGAFRKEA